MEDNFIAADKSIPLLISLTYLHFFDVHMNRIIERVGSVRPWKLFQQAQGFKMVSKLSPIVLYYWRGTISLSHYSHQILAFEL